MNPTAATPMSQEPDRRLASAALWLVCAAGVVAIESTSFAPQTPRPASPLHPWGDAITSLPASSWMSRRMPQHRAGDRWADGRGAGPDQRVVPAAGHRRAAGPVLAGPPAGPRRRRGPGAGGVAARLPILRDPQAGRGGRAVAQ